MAKNVVFVQDPVSFNRAFRSWGGMVGTSIRNATELAAADARLTAPKKTGVLSEGHTTDYGFAPGIGTKELESKVIAVPAHAIFIIKGTKPHVIKPRTPRGRLVFFWKKVGHVVSFKSVNHPGIKANNYIFDALKDVVRRFF